MRVLNSLGVHELSLLLYPNIYDLTQPDEKVGKVVGSRLYTFPLVRCSMQRINPGGIYVGGNFFK